MAMITRYALQPIVFVMIIFGCTVDCFDENKKINKKKYEVSKQLYKKIEKKDFRYSTIKKLLEKKADPNHAWGQKQETSFHQLVKLVAEKYKEIQYIELFMSHKADCNIKDGDNLTPLNYVLNRWNHHLPLISSVLIEVLINHNADPNIQGDFKTVPLHSVFESGDHWFSKTKTLLENKADPTIKNQFGRSPLDYFFNRHQFFRPANDYKMICKMVKLFLRHGVEKKFFEERIGSVALADPSFKVLKFVLKNQLISRKENGDDFERRVLIALIEASVNTDRIQLFLTYGLNPCIKFCNNNFAYEQAHIRNKKEIRNILAYAIPLFIKQKNIQKIQSLKAFVSCVHLVSKMQKKQSIPKPIIALIRERVFDFNLIDTINNQIKRIEKRNIWDKNDVVLLRDGMHQLIERFG